jgi:hypothetical protein
MHIDKHTHINIHIPPGPPIANALTAIDQSQVV